MTLKAYNALGTADRGAPCVEYPGEWLVMLPDGGGMESLATHWNRYWRSEERSHLGHSHATLEDAKTAARGFMSYLENLKVEFDPRFTISWKCSDNDPRLGQVWFTGFYTHGRYNVFGDYKET